MPNSLVRIKNRTEDIKIRGEKCMVLNINHDVVRLRDAPIFYDDEGNYIQPETYVEPECCIGCSIM